MATLLFLRWDGRSVAVLGLDLSWRRGCEFIAGLGGGALLISIVALGAGLVLPFPWVRNPAFEPAALASAFLYFIISNGTEELVFRGYGFERLIAGIGHWPTQLVTAFLFALFHILSGWPWQTALLGTTVGSLLFGLVFVRWRSIPAALGVHVAGNAMRGLLFDDPPTARTFFAPLAPRPWTRAEQLLAALIHAGVTLLFCLVLMRWIQKKRRKAFFERLD
ncbi:MAG TPA: CPBP family intramembrane glutamic endopeptidase [Verrucomicrobiae bacterium]|nr:CPBP family intramembrane glutamic endopeptidase [Verrucomicrobiae bacterium]